MSEIWYEIEDAMEAALEEIEQRVHAECRWEVWEWTRDESTNEGALVGRFPSRRLAQLFIAALQDRMERTGRGIVYPRDAQQTAMEAFDAMDVADSTVH